MSNFEDLSKMVKLLDESTEGKTYIGTTKVYSYYFGKSTSL